MRKILFLLLALAAPLSAQTERNAFNSENYPISYDGRMAFEPEKRPVREIEVIRRAPLFANLPFLRLRAGDELVKGEVKPGFVKSSKVEMEKAYFLKRGGNYEKVAVNEAGGALTLWDWSNIRFFDWEPTRDNAEKLWNWSRSRDQRLTIEQLRRVETVLLPDFADLLGDDWQEFTDFERWQETITIAGKAQPKPIPQPGFINTFAGDEKSPGPNWVFAGLGFDSWDATFYACQMQFGSAGAVFFRKPILVGPKPVEYSRLHMSSGMNSRAGGGMAKGRELLLLQAQDARNAKFLKLVNGVLKPPRPLLP